MGWSEREHVLSHFMDFILYSYSKASPEFPQKNWWNWWELALPHHEKSENKYRQLFSFTLCIALFHLWKGSITPVLQFKLETLECLLVLFLWLFGLELFLFLCSAKWMALGAVAPETRQQNTWRVSKGRDISHYITEIQIWVFQNTVNMCWEQPAEVLTSLLKRHCFSIKYENGMSLISAFIIAL